MSTFNAEQKAEFKTKSEVLQQTAWDLLHKSEAAYEAGQFELALDLDKAYCRTLKDSQYYEQLSYSH